MNGRPSRGRSGWFTPAFPCLSGYRCIVIVEQALKVVPLVPIGLKRAGQDHAHSGCSVADAWRVRPLARRTRMRQRNDDAAEPTWPERLQRLQQLRDPRFLRIGAAHEEGDYETRDRLWREVENLRNEHGLK